MNEDQEYINGTGLRGDRLADTFVMRPIQSCVAKEIIEPHKIDGKDNFADIFTKPVDGTTFKYHAWDLRWKTPKSQ